MKVGIDLVDTERFVKLIENRDFLEKNFTEDEINYIKDRSVPYVSMAGIFAAKEAFLKALEVGVFNGISLKEVEIKHKEGGAPYIVLPKKVLDKVGNLDINISISHDKGSATAICGIV